MDTPVLCPAPADLALDRLVISPEGSAMAPMARRPAGRGRQYADLAIEGMDRRLLVNADRVRPRARAR